MSDDGPRLSPEELEQVKEAIGFDDDLDTVGQKTDLDAFYVLVSGYLVFFMQCGFCMLSAGSVRGKNAKNIILKNLLDTCFGALGWYFLGYGLAFGRDKGDFLGGNNFALKDLPTAEYHNWLFQFAFAATATTIVSGAVAERTKFEAYLIYALFLTAWVYPTIVHWVWSEEGWLSVQPTRKSDLFNDSGLVDFAGSGVVHMTGGLSGLAGAWIVGPRLGRFDADGGPREIPGHSASLALLGVFILWFGWYGFNPGSALAVVGKSDIASLAAVTTTLAAATGCITTLLVSMLINFILTGQSVWDVIGAGNGVLAGLVSITAGCAVVHPWASIIIGAIGGVVYVAASNFVLHILKVDDPLDAIAVHAFCGMWGLVGSASFADEDLVRMTFGDLEANEDGSPGRREFGWVAGGSGRLLATAITGILVIFGWVFVHMVPFFLMMKFLHLLRVSPEQEHEGLDVSHHGGSAYPKDLVKFERAGEHSSQHGGVAVRDLLNDLDTLKSQMRQMQQLRTSRDMSIDD